jgi:signal transduction histidine kinase
MNITPFNRHMLAVVAAATLVSAVLILTLGPRMPPGIALLFNIAAGSFSVGTMLFTAWLWRDTGRQGQHAYLLVVMVYGNLFGLPIGLIAFPYLEPAERLIVIMLATALVGTNALNTVMVPGWGVHGWFLRLAPWMPLALCAILYAISWDRLAPAALAVLLIATILMLAIRSLLQIRVNGVHADLQRAEAERDARQRTSERFLASASHDMEQPLLAARHSIEQLSRSSDPGVRHRAMERIDWAFDSVETMAQQITQHLRLKSGAVSANIGDVPLAPVLGRVVALNEPAARLAGSELRAVFTALRVAGDEALVERALGNFVGNAIRHSKARRLLIGARRAGAMIRIWVIDDGVGIAQADVARLFSDYAQGDHKGETRGGYGLGLGSALRMAQLMRGTAGHDPRWTRGAAFFLELPRL